MPSLRAIIAVLSSLVVGLSVTPRADAAARPNVVVIVADDLGQQLGCYGDKVTRTPNLDRLAADATRFTRAYCTTASCSASRSVIMSGLYNHATGHYGHAHGDGHFSTYESVRSLPMLLKEAGYRTCLVGKYHLAPEYVYPFEAVKQEGTQGSRNTVRMAQNAKAWIAEKDERPFFLYFCPTDPHRSGRGGDFANHADQPNFYPGITPITFRTEDVPVPAWLPDRPEVRKELAEYYQSIARMDVGIGTLLDALKDGGHWDNTLVLFLSDNGPPFPGAKTTCYEPGINLPLIVRDPQQTQRGITCDAMVTWVDLAPTILDYCGVKPADAPPLRPGENVGKAATAGRPQPYKFHGRSFAGIVGQEHPSGWDEMFASHTFHEITMYYPMRVVRSGKYKYILNIAHGLPYPFASDLHASPTWEGVLARNNSEELYGQRSVRAYLHRPRHELYDLDADPHEAHNLAENAAHQDTLKKLQQKLQTWQKQTQDPWELKWRYE